MAGNNMKGECRTWCYINDKPVNVEMVPNCPPLSSAVNRCQTVHISMRNIKNWTPWSFDIERNYNWPKIDKIKGHEIWEKNNYGNTSTEKKNRNKRVINNKWERDKKTYRQKKES